MRSIERVYSETETYKPIQTIITHANVYREELPRRACEVSDLVLFERHWMGTDGGTDGTRN